jgi:membrane protein CcdC involved in cytochrome C biogenesis
LCIASFLINHWKEGKEILTMFTTTVTSSLFEKLVKTSRFEIPDKAIRLLRAQQSFQDVWTVSCHFLPNDKPPPKQQ